MSHNRKNNKDMVPIKDIRVWCRNKYGSSWWEVSPELKNERKKEAETALKCKEIIAIPPGLPPIFLNCNHKMGVFAADAIDKGWWHQPPPGLDSPPSDWLSKLPSCSKYGYYYKDKVATPNWDDWHYFFDESGNFDIYRGNFLIRRLLSLGTHVVDVVNHNEFPYIPMIFSQQSPLEFDEFVRQYELELNIRAELDDAFWRDLAEREDGEEWEPGIDWGCFMERALTCNHNFKFCDLQTEHLLMPWCSEVERLEGKQRREKYY
jgi:hypothetical protein